MTDPKQGDAARLESLWEGRFGDEYTDRNAQVGASRGPFWTSLLARYPIQTVLEVGCNLGANLRWISSVLPGRQVYGVDVNESAVRKVRADLPDVNAVWSKARDLPFRDGFFDLAFTAGVLIHQSPDALPIVMSQIVRCSGRFVLAAEYFAEQTTEIPYRGQAGALYKDDYGGLYQKSHPRLNLLEKGFLSRADGWDDVTWWLFEKAG